MQQNLGLVARQGILPISCYPAMAASPKKREDANLREVLMEEQS